MARPKPNPYKQALVNALDVWGKDAFIEALTKVDAVFGGSFTVSRDVLFDLMKRPPAIKRPERSLKDPIEIDSIEAMLGTCAVCGKLKAEILVRDEESGSTVPVCGDCYPHPAAKANIEDAEEPKEGTSGTLTDPEED